MRMSDEEYFRSCVAKERILAKLLGHENIEECYESAGTLWDNAKALPKWTRDWSACGPLMVQYDLSPIYDHPPDHAPSTRVTIGAIVAQFSDHPSKQQAVMYAIVKAAIHVLEYRKAHHVA
ncbi:aminoacyl-tRNA synthetase [Collimonas sp. NPDC087041]|uniref:aminoacyl-tRNA synthetase n=1 Tax=Collimonas sp. NPDC087041 TaxID=3363960 RepID=UPI00381EA025